MQTELLIVGITIVLSFLFSGLEIAFVSANRLRIELKAKQGDSTGVLLSNYVKKMPQVITTILVGNNVALVVYGIYIAGPLNLLIFNIFGLVPEERPYQVLILQTIISTLIILISGEYLPKAIFRLNPDALLFRFARVLQLFYRIFSPLAIFISTLSRFFLKTILRMKYEEETMVFSKEDLNLYMQQTLARMEHSPQVPEIDTEMFSNAMEFNETRVREFMIPRTEIRAMSVEASILDLQDKFIETELSRILIYEGSLDNVVGFVHSSSLFRRPQDIRTVLQPVLVVPETMQANVLLREFNKNRKTVAIVVDEFGGTEGLVTLEDLVEVVFGEIEDEHDEAESDEYLQKQLDPNTWLLSARMYVDDLNKDLNLSLPTGEYTTLSGMVMHYTESIPAPNEIVEIEGFRITIMEASENKISVLKIERLTPAQGI